MINIAVVTGAPCSGKSTTSAAIRAPVLHVDAYLDDGVLSQMFQDTLMNLINSDIKSLIIDVDSKRYLEVKQIVDDLDSRYPMNLLTVVLKPKFKTLLGIKCREGKVKYSDQSSKIDYDTWYSVYPDNAATFSTHSGAKKVIIDFLRN